MTYLLKFPMYPISSIFCAKLQKHEIFNRAIISMWMTSASVSETPLSLEIKTRLQEDDI
jgi:hypothetical protein